MDVFQQIQLQFNNRPKQSKLRYYHHWTLTKPLCVEIVDKEIIIIPAGFGTDLSSVPRFLWFIMPPFGNFLLAALVHDYMYATNYRESDLGTYQARKLADETMLFISNKYNNENWFKRADNYIRYAGVRLFGSWIYNK
jgi:hypothetical protein